VAYRGLSPKSARNYIPTQKSAAAAAQLSVGGHTAVRTSLSTHSHQPETLGRQCSTHSDLRIPSWYEYTPDRVIQNVSHEILFRPFFQPVLCLLYVSFLFPLSYFLVSFMHLPFLTCMSLSFFMYFSLRPHILLSLSTVIKVGVWNQSTSDLANRYSRALVWALYHLGPHSGYFLFCTICGGNVLDAKTSVKFSNTNYLI
jgi:hypothetical protein